MTRICFMCKREIEGFKIAGSEYLCGDDAYLITSTFTSLLGISYSFTGDFGIEIEYRDILNVLKNIERDEKARYILVKRTDEELMSDKRFSFDVLAAARSFNG